MGVPEEGVRPDDGEVNYGKGMVMDVRDTTRSWTSKSGSAWGMIIVDRDLHVNLGRKWVGGSTRSRIASVGVPEEDPAWLECEKRDGREVGCRREDR